MGAMEKLEGIDEKLDNLPDRLKAVLDMGRTVAMPPAAVPRGSVPSVMTPPRFGGATTAAPQRQAKQADQGGQPLQAQAPIAAGSYSRSYAMPSVMQTAPRLAAALGGNAAPVARGQQSGSSPALQLGGAAGGSNEGTQALAGLLRQILGELRGGGKPAAGPTGRASISGPTQAGRSGLFVGTRERA